MSASSQTAPTSYWSAVWRPGIRGLLVFVALAVVGFLVFLTTSPGFAERLLGGWYSNLFTFYSGSWFVDTMLTVGVRCLIALAVGFVFPRGFYLWGLALVIHTPLTTTLTLRAANQEGIEIVSGEPVAILSYGFVSLMLVTFAALVYTCFSALGMLARYLLNRRSA